MPKIRKSDQDQGSVCIEDQSVTRVRDRAQRVVVIRLIYGYSQDSGYGHIVLFD